MKPKIVFMGTPDFAREILAKLHEKLGPVAAVVTQPDRPKGRGGALEAPPVKKFAEAHGIPVFQPERASEVVEPLKEIAPDFIVVAAFGQLLKKDILDIPNKCCMNVHASLLPRHRGASPIHRAIIEGDEVTGVSTMKMDEGLDTGDILLTAETMILPGETTPELHDRLAAAGAALCVETILKYDSITPVKQDESKATYTGRLLKTDGVIDWNKDAVKIDALVRGCLPWPGAYTFHNGKTLKILRAEISSDNSVAAAPGIVVKAGSDGVVVAAGKGAVVIRELQLEGKKRMDAGSFLNGYSLAPGDKLGE